MLALKKKVTSLEISIMIYKKSTKGKKIWCDYLITNCFHVDVWKKKKKKINLFPFFIQLWGFVWHPSVGDQIFIQVYGESFLNLKFIQLCHINFRIPLSPWQESSISSLVCIEVKQVFRSTSKYSCTWAYHATCFIAGNGVNQMS